MTSIKASVFIITKNEGGNLPRLLPLLQAFEEVVVVDCGSTDDTEAVARSFSNVKFVHQDWLGFSQQKDFARSLCKNEWVLNLDADETFDPELLDEIRAAIAANQVCGMMFDCAEVLLGVRIPHALTDHRPKLRFFRKDHAHYPQASVHEKIKVDGQVTHGKARIYNWGTEMEVILQKQNLYSSLAASERDAQGKKASLFKLTFRAPFSFFRYYVLKRHALDGVEGFISAVNYAHYAFQKEAKLYLLNKNRLR